MEMLLSEKNKPMSHFEGYLYWQKGQKGKRTFWHCIFNKIGADGDVGSKCPGRASTIDGIVKVTTTHNHYADKIRVELKLMQGSGQKQAKESKELPRVIIGDSMELMSEHSKPMIRRSLTSRNIRHEANMEPPNPQSLGDLKIPTEFTKLGKEVFFKFDGWHNDERIQIFTTERCLDFLESNKKWGANATFDPTPLLFGQLWIVFVRLGHTYVPIVFGT